MIVQSLSSRFFSSPLPPTASQRQYPAASPANTAERVSISQAARDMAAAQVTRTTRAVASGDGATAEFDTTKGPMQIDIAACFTPPMGQSVDLDSIPLLLPSRKNIDALSGYVSGQMPAFLADNGIPTPPASITYDSRGQIQLPADYAYAAEFKQALADNPVMERALRTTSALTSQMVEMNKSIPFQQEYAAAGSQAEIDAVIAKYHYLFAANRHTETIALHFTVDGNLSLTHDGKPLSAA